MYFLVLSFRKIGIKMWELCHCVAGVSKGTPGDAKCVTEILWGTKIRKLRGTKFKIVATRCHILRLKCTKFDFGWGPRWGSSERSPDPLAGFKGSYF